VDQVASAGKKAVILLSGGLDSATILALAHEAGYDLYALSFEYGQRHHIELEKAQIQAQVWAVTQHMVLTIDDRLMKGSALTGGGAVPKGVPLDRMGQSIPVTYVPARNTVFLSYALAWAEGLDADSIWIGVNALDYSGYPDCRPEYIDCFQKLVGLATKKGLDGQIIQICTPLIHWTKAQIIQQGVRLGVNYRETSSCYDPSSSGVPCGCCDACQLRAAGFAQAGYADPLVCR
jgi:7-cyano-7-deazaguanine synthase